MKRKCPLKKIRKWWTASKCSRCYLFCILYFIFMRANVLYLIWDMWMWDTKREQTQQSTTLPCRLVIYNPLLTRKPSQIFFPFWNITRWWKIKNKKRIYCSKKKEKKKVKQAKKLVRITDKIQLWRRRSIYKLNKKKRKASLALVSY